MDVCSCVRGVVMCGAAVRCRGEVGAVKECRRNVTFGNGENEAEDRLPLARTLGIAMVAVLVACDSAAVPLSFGMILNSSSIVPQKPQRTFILSLTLARMPPPPL